MNEMTITQRRDGISLFIFLGIAIAVMILGGLFTFAGVRDWYPALTKPAFTPPSWVFGPVWTVLYIAIGVSGWLLWRERKRQDIRIPLTLYTVQLALNLLWSLFFFGLRNPALGLLDIAALWLVIVAFIVTAWKVSRSAAALFIPYALWVSFATMLNFEIWRLNG